MLHFAAMGDRAISIVYFARVQRMDVAVRDIKNRTPLHWAVNSDSRTVLEYILAHPQDLELKDNHGNTALH